MQTDQDKLKKYEETYKETEREREKIQRREK